MIRTRPTGVAMIVIAALVSTSTAYLLATRTLEQTGPAANQPAVPLPATAIDEHEAAVQATLLCLAAAGLAPLVEPTRAKSVTRITVDPKSIDPATAEAIIADCGADAELRMLDGTMPGSMLRASSDLQRVARTSFEACLPGSTGRATAGSGEVICLDDIFAATGLHALGTPQ